MRQADRAAIQREIPPKSWCQTCGKGTQDEKGGAREVRWVVCPGQEPDRKANEAWKPDPRPEAAAVEEQEASVRSEERQGAGEPCGRHQEQALRQQCPRGVDPEIKLHDGWAAPSFCNAIIDPPSNGTRPWAISLAIRYR